MNVNKLKRIIDCFPKKRVMIIGDFVADEFIFGKTSRISREAPVLILDFVSRDFLLGGAGNAAHNLAALSAEVIPVGVIGDDEAGRGVVEGLEAAGMNTQSMFSVKGYSTTTKTRITAGSHHTSRQQIVRVDRGGYRKIPSSVEKKILKTLEEQFKNVDALVVSDYSHGVISEAVIKKVNQLGGRKKALVTVDSRNRMLSFRHVTAVTPNEPEVEAALGLTLGDRDGEVRRAGEKIFKKVRPGAVLITRGSRGMALFPSEGKAEFIPIVGTDEVTDVTGAGDTVIAVFTLALSSGAGFLEAAHIANIAGGIVVMKHGTATVERAELYQTLRTL